MDAANIDLIPTPADQNPLAQLRSPMDMIVQGRSMSLFQASQHHRILTRELLGSPNELS